MVAKRIPAPCPRCTSNIQPEVPINRRLLIAVHQPPIIAHAKQDRVELHHRAGHFAHACRKPSDERPRRHGAAAVAICILQRRAHRSRNRCMPRAPSVQQVKLHLPHRSIVIRRRLRHTGRNTSRVAIRRQRRLHAPHNALVQRKLLRREGRGECGCAPRLQVVAVPLGQP